MEKDRFDDMIVEIENKTFEINMMISAFAAEMLTHFEDLKIDVNAEIVYDFDGGDPKRIFIDTVFFNPEDELIYIKPEGEAGVICWDDLDLSTRDLLINEMHCRYKSDLLFKKMNSSDADVH